LVDPVLSNHASPFRWMNKGFKGTDTFNVEDLPGIDYLLITHDHFDHLDYETVSKLKGKVKTVISGLGVGAHFEKWGYPASMLIEKDWGDTVNLDDKLTLHLTPARHYSGRRLFRNNTLWTSFVVEIPTKKIFIGGNSGYYKHFSEIGKLFGGFDLAILENGQYNEAWRYIHTLPKDVLQASKDLKARRTFPVHSSKFNLGGHPWKEPLKKICELNVHFIQPLFTPMIGQVVELYNEEQVFQKWWEDVK
jgi:L-ascorbate metabolism protein UlaG (beta-lactamase superfamily)